MRTLVYVAQFKKDYKRCQKRGYDMQTLVDVENEVPLSPRLKEHPLPDNKPPPSGKDYNDHLCDRFGLPRTKLKERSCAR
ncbi:MAG: type II toxin-antitoxin system YafQ family toxin [Oscillospiraceae bacterium]|jgi:mRNA-degrading endonuclease YafQ of YafQ-DinJ toxin-antitoxin module|nr:type II toxin-antitoxin system YafQ family toxin [Oscillospiraceae bacterium]